MYVLLTFYFLAVLHAKCDVKVARHANRSEMSVGIGIKAADVIMAPTHPIKQRKAVIIPCTIFRGESSIWGDSLPEERLQVP